MTPRPGSWSQEIERLGDPSHWACLNASHMRALGKRAGLALQREHSLTFELNFDDWLKRGTASVRAHDLVNRALADKPNASTCFNVTNHAHGRILTLQIWLGLWRRP